MGRILRKQLLQSLATGEGAPALASDMAAAIIVHDAEPWTARRATLGDMASALVLHTNQRAFDALVRGRIGTCVRLARLDGILTGFITDLALADPDPGADMIRVSLLRLQLSGARSADCPALRPALAAMSEIAATGSVAVQH